jgi:DNA-binding IscR family transcriptional regulator
MKDVRDATAKILDRTTLSDMMKHDAGAGALT